MQIYYLKKDMHEATFQFTHKIQFNVVFRPCHIKNSLFMIQDFHDSFSGAKRQKSFTVTMTQVKYALHMLQQWIYPHQVRRDCMG